MTLSALINCANAISGLTHGRFSLFDCSRWGIVCEMRHEKLSYYPTVIVGSGLKTSTPSLTGALSYMAMTSSGIGVRSVPRMKSRKEVPNGLESTFQALFPLRRSLRCTARKSMLKRVRPDVFGTVECIFAAE